jgi:hypothetical protein
MVERRSSEERVTRGDGGGGGGALGRPESRRGVGVAGVARGVAESRSVEGVEQATSRDTEIRK